MLHRPALVGSVRVVPLCDGYAALPLAGEVPGKVVDWAAERRKHYPHPPCRLRAAESWAGRAGHRAQIFWFWRPGCHAIVPGITVWSFTRFNR